MTPAEFTFLIIYFAVLGGLAFYGSHRYHMAWLYYRHRRDIPQLPCTLDELDEVPHVTIQLPVFNERYVVRRLIDHVCAIRYPRERLEIQVLDDSTDDTCEIARSAVEEWRARGIDIVYIHRTDRSGFKAGALEAGLASAKGEFVAVFDADFKPQPDFLEQTVPFFGDPEIGMVQARWGHINKGFSLLTRVQSIMLDGHFVIEHTARNRSGRFFNFNGTAGIWRRTTIADAGGWEHDTLTEDLDLSYRAQLKGWRFVFRNDLLAPAELPVEMNAFKNQQHRWAKGSIQVALKLLPRILKSDASRKVKREAFMHLTNNLAYVLMIVMSVMLPFTLHLRIDHGWYKAVLLDLPFFLGATVSICFFYLLAQNEAGNGTRLQRVLYLPIVMSIGIGLAVNNAVATLEALFGHESPFVRTPKLAVDEATGEVRVPRSKRYRGAKSIMPFLELGLGLVYTYTVFYCIAQALWLALPFMLLFQFGFLYIGIMSLFQWVGLNRRTAKPAKKPVTAA